VPWSEDTFTRLIAAPPETLTSSFSVSHALLLNVLDRPRGGVEALTRLLHDNHESRPAQRRHIRRAVAIARSLLSSGVVERVVEPDGRVGARVAVDLQADFALDQPLSPFVLEAIGHLDRDEPTYPLDVLSLVEATLESPGTIIAAQVNRAKTELMAELKARGVEYEERIAALEKVEHPKPLRELTYDLFDAYRLVHPWVEDHNIRPKSVARELFERAMTFSEYVDHYGLARSEGLLLRYLSDAYKGVVRTVPEDAKTDELDDLTAWLGELVGLGVLGETPPRCWPPRPSRTTAAPSGSWCATSSSAGWSCWPTGPTGRWASWAAGTPSAGRRRPRPTGRPTPASARAPWRGVPRSSR